MNKPIGSRPAVTALAIVLWGCSFAPNKEESAAPPTNQATPIACTLTPEQLSSRRDQLLPGLIREAEKVTDLEHGLRMQFANRADLLGRLISVVEQERTCCSFLRFQITAEPENGPVILDVTGPPGTRELLRSL